MTFEEKMAEIGKEHLLPEMAIRHIPEALQARTIHKLEKLETETVVSVLQKAVGMVNEGSTDSLDVLVNRLLP